MTLKRQFQNIQLTVSVRELRIKFFSPPESKSNKDTSTDLVEDKYLWAASRMKMSNENNFQSVAEPWIPLSPLFAAPTTFFP